MTCYDSFVLDRYQAQGEYASERQDLYEAAVERQVDAMYPRACTAQLIHEAIGLSNDKAFAKFAQACVQDLPGLDADHVSDSVCQIHPEVLERMAYATRQLTSPLAGQHNDAALLTIGLALRGLIAPADAPLASNATLKQMALLLGDLVLDHVWYLAEKAVKAQAGQEDY